MASGMDEGAAQAVAAWLGARGEDVSGELSWAVVAGGRSNLTYVLSDEAGRRWVLRRPPISSVLPSAHDMGREHRIQAALHGTPVPVARMVGYCDDVTLVGSPFYVMEHVDGLVVRTSGDAAASLDEPARRAVAMALVDRLVDLHGVDPDSVGLGQLGPREDYVARQLHRWSKQLAQAGTRELPVVQEVHRRLKEAIPPQGPARIVHGDYRLDNAIVTPAGTVAAILDWELCALGDPLCDVGMLWVYWAEPGDALAALPDAPTTAPGFPGRREVVARYAERADRELDAALLAYYVAFASWKLAAVLEGVYSRYRAGAYGDAAAGVDIEAYGTGVSALAEHALAVLEDPAAVGG